MQSVVENFFVWKSDTASLNSLLESDSFSLSQQHQLLKLTVYSEQNRRFPVNWQFQQKFCKSLIKLLECRRQEVGDELYDSLRSGSTTVGIDNSNSVQHSYKSYFIENQVIPLVETVDIISNGTTGLSTWPAGVHLCHWLAQQPLTWAEGASVLELGSGAGITGIFAVNVLPQLKEYIFTDCHPLVLSNLRHNVDLSRPAAAVDCQIRQVDWHDQGHVNSLPPVDIVLGADIVFDTRVIPDLVLVIKSLIKRKNGVAVISSTIRNDTTYNFFLDELTRQSLVWLDLNYECVELVKIIQIK